jgi:hypothetical protein
MNLCGVREIGLGGCSILQGRPAQEPLDIDPLLQSFPPSDIALLACRDEKRFTDKLQFFLSVDNAVKFKESLGEDVVDCETSTLELSEELVLLLGR